MRFLEHRIGDKRVLRLITKWLNAGVMEDGEWKDDLQGTPQGAVVSPILANVYLHYVLDLWFQKKWRARQATGDTIIVRYADDFVVVCQRKADAAQFLHDLRERMSQFALELHPDKTRLVEFGRFAMADRRARGERRPETFDFLGFTHYCKKKRNGKFGLGRKPIAKRVTRRVRLFFVEKFSPYSWAFLPADASLQCSVRGDSNQASTYPRLSGGQPSLETVPNTVGLSPSGALPSGHSRGVLVRFHGQGDRPVMAVTTGFQGRRFDVPEARTGVPRIDLPSPAPCAAADAVFADAKAFLSSNEARQMSESELERELHRRGQKLVRKLLQGHHDQRSPGQVAGPAEDASGVECSAWREHDSHAETTSGTMQVVGLGCARRGHDGLHPLDAALNLLPERSLVDMRRRVTIATASRAPPRTPWKPQWYSTLSTWQRRCGVRCSSPAP